MCLHALGLDNAFWSNAMSQSAPSDSTPRRVAFVHAQWHAPIVAQARDAFCAEMHRLGARADSIDVVEVPGAF